MTEQQKTPPQWQLSGANFPYRQFVLGALMPITFFYTMHRLNRPLVGALLAIAWSLSLLSITYCRSRRIELFPGLAIPLVLIELVGTLISRNPAFYLASAAIENVLWGLLFLVSILFPRPLIQIFAELLNPGLGSQDFFSQSKIPPSLYRSAWQILTAAWGVVSLSKAIILIFAQLRLPLEVFLAVRTASGIPVMAIMLVFSYRFPQWYWERTMGKNLS